MIVQLVGGLEVPPVELVMCSTSTVEVFITQASEVTPRRAQDDRLHLSACRLCLRFEATEVLREVLEVFRLGLPEAVEGEGRRAAQSVPLV